MASVRKEGKRMVKEKLKQIKLNTKFITDYVELLCSEAEQAGEEFLYEKDKHLFIEQFHPVMNKLDTTARKLFLLKASVSQETDQSSSSSSDSEEEQYAKRKQCDKDVKTTDHSDTPKPVPSVKPTGSSSETNVKDTVTASVTSEETAAHKPKDLADNLRSTSKVLDTVYKTDERKGATLGEETELTKEGTDITYIKSDASVETEEMVKEKASSLVHCVVREVDGQLTKVSVSENKQSINIASQSEVNFESISENSIKGPGEKTEVIQCDTGRQEDSGSGLTTVNEKSEISKDTEDVAEQTNKSADEKVEEYFLRKRKIDEAPVVKKLVSSSTTTSCTRGLGKMATPVKKDDCAELEGQKEAVTPSSYMPPAPSEATADRNLTGKLGSDNPVAPKEECVSVVRNSAVLKTEMAVGSNPGEQLKTTQKSKVIKCQVVKDGKSAPKIRKVKVKCEKMSVEVVSEDSLRKYVVDYGIGPEIPRLEVKEGKTLDIIITEVHSPSLFWVQNLGESAKLNDLMEDLCSFHQALQSGDAMYKLKYRPPGGTLLAAQFSQDNNWYRARVISRWFKKDAVNVYDKGSHLVEVLYIDYGNKERLSVSKLRPLHPNHATLPAQAFPCALSEVGPVCSEWTSIQCQEFANFMLGAKGIHATFTDLPGSALTFCHLYIPKQVPLPTLSLFPGPQANELVDVGETYVKESKLAAKVSNEVLSRNFEESSGSMDPDPKNPELKCFIKLSEVFALSHPLISEDSIKPFPSDTVPEDCQQSDTTSNIQDRTSPQSLQCTQSAARTESEVRSLKRNSPSPDTPKEGSCDQGRVTKEKKALTLPRVPQICLSGLSGHSTLGSKASDVSGSIGKYGDTGNQATGSKSSDDRAGSTGNCGDIRNQATGSKVTGEMGSDDERFGQTGNQPKGSDNNQTGAADAIQIPDRTEAEHASVSFPEMCVTVPEDGRLPFMMSFIFNPKCFFIHMATIDSASTVDNLMSQLNAYYSSESTNSLLLKKYMSEGALRTGDIVCARFSEDKRYYRAQVLSIQTTKVHVFYVDFGNNEWLPREQIYPLPPKFAEHPPQAVCCTLAGISRSTSGQEVEGEEEECWDTEMTQEFVKLTGFEKELYGFIVGVREGEILRPSKSEPVQLLVLDTNETQDQWINQELERLGIATFHPPPEYYELMKKMVNPEGVEVEGRGWDPMSQDFLSERNSYLIDTDDPGVATAGYSSTDDQLEEVLQKVKVTSYVDLWMNHMASLTNEQIAEGTHVGIVPYHNTRSFAKYVEKTLNPFLGQNRAMIIEKMIENDFTPAFKKREKKNQTRKTKPIMPAGSGTGDIKYSKEGKLDVCKPSMGKEGNSDKKPSEEKESHLNKKPSKVKHSHLDKKPSEESESHFDKKPSEEAGIRSDKKLSEGMESHSDKKPIEGKESNSDKKPSEEKNSHSDKKPSKVKDSHLDKKLSEEKESNSDKKPREGMGSHSDKKPTKGKKSHPDKEPSEGKESNSDMKPNKVNDSHLDKKPSEEKESHLDKKPSEGMESHLDRKPSEWMDSNSDKKLSEGMENHSNKKPTEGKESNSDKKPSEGTESNSNKKPSKVKDSHSDKKPSEETGSRSDKKLSKVKDNRSDKKSYIMLRGTVHMHMLRDRDSSSAMLSKQNLRQETTDVTAVQRSTEMKIESQLPHSRNSRAVEEIKEIQSEYERAEAAVVKELEKDVQIVNVVSNDVSSVAVVNDSLTDICKSGGVGYRKSETIKVDSVKKISKTGRVSSRKKLSAAGKSRVKVENKSLLSRQLLCVKGLLEINALSKSITVKEETSSSSKASVLKDSSTTSSYKSFGFKFEKHVHQRQGIHVKKSNLTKYSNSGQKRKTVSSKKDVSTVLDTHVLYNSSLKKSCQQRAITLDTKKGSDRELIDMGPVNTAQHSQRNFRGFLSSKFCTRSAVDTNRLTCTKTDSRTSNCEGRKNEKETATLLLPQCLRQSQEHRTCTDASFLIDSEVPAVLPVCLAHSGNTLVELPVKCEVPQLCKEYAQLRGCSDALPACFPHNTNVPLPVISQVPQSFKASGQDGARYDDKRTNVLLPNSKHETSNLAAAAAAAGDVQDWYGGRYNNIDLQQQKVQDCYQGRYKNKVDEQQQNCYQGRFNEVDMQQQKVQNCYQKRFNDVHMQQQKVQNCYQRRFNEVDMQQQKVQNCYQGRFNDVHMQQQKVQNCYQRRFNEVDMQQQKVQNCYQGRFNDVHMQQQKVQNCYQRRFNEVDMQQQKVQNCYQGRFNDVHMQQQKVQNCYQRRFNEVDMQQQKVQNCFQGRFNEVDMQQQKVQNCYQERFNEVDMQQQKVRNCYQRRFNEVDLQQQKVQNCYQGRFNEVDMQQQKVQNCCQVRYNNKVDVQQPPQQHAQNWYQRKYNEADMQQQNVQNSYQGRFNEVDIQQNGNLWYPLGRMSYGCHSCHPSDCLPFDYYSGCQPQKWPFDYRHKRYHHYSEEGYWQWVHAQRRKEFQMQYQSVWGFLNPKKPPLPPPYVRHCRPN